MEASGKISQQCQTRDFSGLLADLVVLSKEVTALVDSSLSIEKDLLTLLRFLREQESQT